MSRTDYNIAMGNDRDIFWMKRALELAERGRGAVEPNPMVGAVLVVGDRVVGEGWHECFGQAHAEINALNAAGPRAREATLYVTLEPCCHHGKTPPCTTALLQAGLCRVVVAMADPFPMVAGQGSCQLQEAGVQVEVGVEEAKARRLNAPYLKLLARRQPYVHAKWAMSLDGKIATRTGNSKWISNETSRKRVHDLRGRMDAILIGIGTALTDDPLLTARPPGPRTASRIILDSQARLPIHSRLVQTANAIPTIVVASQDCPAERVAVLEKKGCEILTIGPKPGRPELACLLDELGRRPMTNLLVEGGGEVFGSFLDLRAIDEVHVDVAPILIGGRQAKIAFAGLGVEQVAEGLHLQEWVVEESEGDIHIHGWVANAVIPAGQ
jgi:diaminohydroxyphosphoribosylaminopyrimidine deaminase/5-amino-6-(5-phosphoribosylamino)uracil reductase